MRCARCVGGEVYNREGLAPGASRMAAWARYNCCRSGGALLTGARLGAGLVMVGDCGVATRRDRAERERCGAGARRLGASVHIDGVARWQCLCGFGVE